MTEIAAGRGRTVGILTIATGLHALSASTVFVIPAIAPEIAQAQGASAALIGLQVSLVYVGAMVMSALAGGIEARLGTTRATQLSLGVTVVALLLATVPSLPVLGVASLLLGLGYGLIHPPTSVMLSRVTSPATRGLFFSIKQTAVPLGGIMAGLLGPACALLFGWRGALLVPATLGLLTIGLLQLVAANRGDAMPETAAGARAPVMRDLQLLWNIPPLRWTTLGAFWFAGIQFTLTSYLVVLLVENVGVGLVAAGVGLSIFQAAAMGGRVFWGVLADATRAGLVILGIAFGVSLASLLLLPFMSAQWSLAAIYACLGLLGMGCAGWNGVFVSEVVRLAPPGAAGRAIGASFVYSFGGAVTIPPLFGLVYHSFHAYAGAAWMLAAVAAAGCGCILRAQACARQREPIAPPTDRHA